MMSAPQKAVVKVAVHQWVAEECHQVLAECHQE
jgi:hypothetical protein